MATRSTIAIENNDGTVSQVYCHWDGYLEGVGKTILEHYNTREAVEKLLAGGSISSLGEYVSDDEKSFNKKHDDEDDYTVYYTYRGEDPVIEEFESLSDYEENHQYEEFEYIFTQDNVWSVFFNGDWHDLELELSEKK
jgi:hypothetical protein